EESVAIFREVGDRSGIAYALHQLSSLAKRQSDHEAERARLEESLAIFRELGDRWGIATTLIFLGQMASVRGDYAHARVLFEESVTVSSELGRWALWNIAGVVLNQG